MGELYKDDKRLEDNKKYNEKQHNESVPLAAYANKDGSATLNIFSKSLNGEKLESFVKTQSSSFSGGKYRIGKSEMYQKQGQDINDAYVVAFLNYERPVIAQFCYFQDQDKIVNATLEYICQNISIPDTNIQMYLPSNFKSDTWDGQNEFKDVVFHSMSYDAITELPGVLYTETNSQKISSENEGDTSLRGITQFTAKKFGNPEIQYLSINGIQASKFHLDRYTDPSDGKTYNANVYHFADGDKIITMAIYELSEFPTYALGAFENCIHKEN